MKLCSFFWDVDHSSIWMYIPSSKNAFIYQSVNHDRTLVAIFGWLFLRALAVPLEE